MPDSTYKIVWDGVANAAFLVSLLVSSSILSFDMMTFTTFMSLEISIDCIVFFDMILCFFTAFEDKGNEGLETSLNLNIRDIAKNYLREYFVLDFLAVVPVLIAEIVNLWHLNTHPRELQAMYWFKMLYITKLLRAF